MFRVLLIALLFAMPVFADNVFMNNTTSETNMCVVSVTGQSQSNSAALPTATWSPVTYNCAAGTYLPADGVACATCPAGYYCDGGDYEYNELNATGLNACPSARPSSHAGATSQNACYTPCPSDKIDAGLDGTNCQTPKFTVTTTNLSANTEFKFYMSASGTFYIDCGDGGTLSGTGVTNQTITRTTTTEDLYTCTYTTAGTKTIRFSGTATGYSTTVGEAWTVAAIRFGGSSDVTPTLIAAINGSLGQIFPSFASYNTPRFSYTFRDASNITSIPENLFSGINHINRFMFFDTFRNASNITSIPENLFWGFSGITDHLFFATFAGCTSLTSIPAKLFKNISGSSNDVFVAVFSECTSLTSIPGELFSGISGGSNFMFSGAFQGCTSLTSIPDGLFKGITNSARSMFSGAFTGCTRLSGYIPPSLFAGLIANGSPYNTEETGYYRMMDSIFYNTGSLATTCPSGMTQYITGYEDYWSGHVSCVDANLTCSAGNYLPAHGYECVACPAGSYCVGGQYTYNATTDQGINACAANYTSPTGASSCSPAIYNINYVLNGGNSLPSGFTQLEYLEATDTQYIDTGIAPTNNTGFVIDFQYTNSMDREQIIIGSFDPNFLIDRYNGNFAYAYRGYQGLDESFQMSADALVARTKMELNWKNDGMFRFGDIVRQIPANTFSNSRPMRIFDCNGLSRDGYGIISARVFNVKISNNTTIVRNMIPARRDSDGELGMYDMVSGNFFTNSGTGTFTAGPDTTVMPTNTYTYGTGLTENIVPIRAHSTFVGWCDNAALTSNCATPKTIGTTATGDKTFYAKYLCDTGYSTNVSNTACNANTITVNWDDGNGGYISNTCTYGGDLTTPSTAPTKRGHIFTGWSFNLN